MIVEPLPASTNELHMLTVPRQVGGLQLLLVSQVQPGSELQSAAVQHLVLDRQTPLQVRSVLGQTTVYGWLAEVRPAPEAVSVAVPGAVSIGVTVVLDVPAAIVTVVAVL